MALKSKSLTKPFVEFSGQIANIYTSTKTSTPVININESIENHTQKIQDSNRLNRAHSLNLSTNQIIKQESSRPIENDTKNKLQQFTQNFDLDNIQKSTVQSEEDTLKRKISFRQSSVLQQRLISYSKPSSKNPENESNSTNFECSQNEEKNQSSSKISKINKDQY